VIVKGLGLHGKSLVGKGNVNSTHNTRPGQLLSNNDPNLTIVTTQQQ
jgi:hypothetical protein